MSDKINFKLEYNGETYRFASASRGEQLFRLVSERVASIVKSSDYELFWKDDDSNVVLETAADLATAIDYAKCTRKNSSKTPRILLIAVSTVKSQPSPEVTAALYAVVAAPVVEIQEEPAVDAAAEVLEDAVAFPLFEEDEKQQHRQKLIAAIGQQMVAIEQMPGLSEMRKHMAEMPLHLEPMILSRSKIPMIGRYRAQRCSRSGRPSKAGIRRPSTRPSEILGLGHSDDALFNAFSTFSQLTVAAIRAKIDPIEVRESIAAAFANAGIARYVPERKDAEDHKISADEEDAAILQQNEEEQFDLEIVESAPAVEHLVQPVPTVLQPAQQVLPAASVERMQPVPMTVQQVQLTKEHAEDFIARDRELKIREKVLQLKEETFERTIAIFQLKMEEFEEKFASLGKKVEDIKEKMDTEYLESSMEEMEERLKKVEEKVDDDDIVFM